MIQTLLFPNRTRAELKNKYKLELRRRPWLIEHAQDHAQDILTTEAVDLDNMPADGVLEGHGWDLSDGSVKIRGDLKDKKHPLNARPPITMEYVRNCLKRVYKERLWRKGKDLADSDDVDKENQGMGQGEAAAEQQRGGVGVDVDVDGAAAVQPGVAHPLAPDKDAQHPMPFTGGEDATATAEGNVGASKNEGDDSSDEDKLDSEQRALLKEYWQQSFRCVHVCLCA